jgi:hypothetical protein
MALTRNETTVHEKTGIYQRVSGNQSMGLVMGADIDLRLFLSRWASGLVVVESGAASDVHPKISLQFFDAQGVSVHKVFPVPATNRQTWHNVLAAWVDMSQVLQFNSEPESVDSRRHRHVTDPEILARDWAAMTDTHQFFDLLKRHDLDRLPALCLMQGRFTRKVTTAAVRFTLYRAAFNGLSIMVFVGNPGCIQIHTGPVKRIEPMDINGKQWLNVLDPAFNLHLREDMIDAFLDAGADLAFVEGPKDKEEVAHICQAVKGPVFYNMTGISPRFTAEEMAAIGIRACILPGAAMRATIMAIHDFATTLKAEGPMAEAAYDARFKQHPMGNLHGFAGFDRIREMEAEFLPAEAAEKYQGGLGYAPKAAE